MSVKDVIKNSFLEGMGNSAPSVRGILMCMLVAMLVGAFICIIYKLTISESFYSVYFNMSLILVTVITAAIILTIQSSVIVSLGMVGALSIVRFRTAVKNPLDLVYLFWAISGGIISGCGMTGLVILLSCLITFILVVFKLMVHSGNKRVLVSVAVSNADKSEEIKKILASSDPHFSIESRNLSSSGLNMMASVKSSDPDELLKNLHKIEGVLSVSIVPDAAKISF